jgi:hypothetical protein
MGRYYSGDIKGKFWFGVQPSDDADFFGGQQSEPAEISYSFTGDDLPTVEQGITKCIAELGDNKAKLDAFFGEGGKGHEGYRDEMIATELSISEDAVRGVLAWYARLGLGIKIRDCIKEQGDCSFDAEI